MVDEVAERWREGRLPYALEKARAHPEWVDEDGDDEREIAIAELSAALH